MRRARFAVVAMIAATAASVLIVAGCSSSKKAATTTTGASTTSTTAKSSTSTAAGSTTTAAGVPMCLTKDLAITNEDSQGAAGTISVVFKLTNTSGRSCELNGYPGIAAQFQDGKEAPTTAERGGTKVPSAWPGPSRVVIDNGKSGYFFMAYSDVPTGDGACAQFPRTAVTPPNNKDSASVAFGINPCTVNGTYIVNVSAVSGSKH